MTPRVPPSTTADLTDPGYLRRMRSYWPQPRWYIPPGHWYEAPPGDTEEGWCDVELPVWKPKRKRRRTAKPAQDPFKRWFEKRYPNGDDGTKPDKVLQGEAEQDGVAAEITAIRRAIGRRI